MKIELNKVLGYSKDCLQSRALMRAVILDLYPGEIREMNILLAVYESGIPRDIKSAGKITNEQYSSYVRKIVDDYGLQEKYAVEGLNAWIDICIAPGTSVKMKYESATANNNGPEIKPIQHAPIVAQSVKDVSGSELDFQIKQISGNHIEIVKFKGFDETELVIPSDIKGKKVIGVGKEAYEACKNVEKIIIAEGIEYLEDGAFANCANLKNIILPSTLKRIGTKGQNNTSDRYSYLSYRLRKGAFEDTRISSIVLPTALSYLGEATFKRCNCLKQIDIPNGVNEIKDYTFYGCKSLKTVVFPDHLVSIGSSAFSNCGLETIVLPNSVRTLGSSVFSDCKVLSRVQLNEGLKTIGDSAFKNCEKMTKIVIPSTVTSIGKELFNITGWYQPSDRRRNGWSTNSKNTKVKFYCYAGSMAIEYARKEGYPIENAAKLTQ